MLLHRRCLQPRPDRGGRTLVARVLESLGGHAPRRSRLIAPAEARESVSAQGQRRGTVLRLVGRQQHERAFDQAKHLFVGADGQRVLRRLGEERGRAHGVGRRAGLVQVVRDLGRVFLGRLAVNTLQRVPDGQVVGLQPRQGHSCQHALADQVVREPVALVSRPGQKPCLGGLLERLAQLAARQLAEGLEQRDIEVAPDHRCRCEHPVRGLAEALEAPADEPAHALRKLQVLLRVTRLRSGTHATEEALGLRHIEV